MEYLAQYAVFFAKALTVFAFVVIPILLIGAISSRQREHQKEHLEVNHLNQRYEAMSNSIQSIQMPKKQFKEQQKKHKKEQKKKHKQASADQADRKRVCMLNFEGDVQASQIDKMREEITAILTLDDKPDEVVIKIESMGGAVHAYGLAASQLARIKDKGIALTVAVDKVAASGGYLMACVADKIIAAPFAVLGSVGVLAQIPNFHRALKEHNVDYHEFTAGEYKRTVSMFAEPTEKGKAKLKEDIEQVHDLFKDFVKSYRPQIDLDKVATGEHWHGTKAIELNLVDELRTSDDYLLESSSDADIYEIKFVRKQSFAERLKPSVEGALRLLAGRHSNSINPMGRI